MSFLNKISNRYIFLFSIIIIISSNKIYVATEYCDIDKKCDNCDFCGEETKDYTSCSYYNLFCLQNNGGIYYNDDIVYNYIDALRSINGANEFCGQETYSLDSSTKSFTIINKSNKNIKSLDMNHCNYLLYNNYYFNNHLDIANLVIKLSTNDSKNNYLKLIIYILVQSSSTSRYAKLTQSNLFSKDYELSLTDYQYITILIDFNKDENYNKNIDEYFEIKVNLNNSNNKKINRIINAVLIVIFCILGISIIASIIYIVYRRKKNREMNRVHIEALQQEELQRKQKQEKINKLFETILVPKEFNESDIANDCTECAICIEKFADKCLICVTPCKHIFHYECLKKLIETAKKKQKPIVKCPLCNYDFLEEKDDEKKLNENNNENENNNNQINNNENNAQQVNYTLMNPEVIHVNCTSRSAVSEQNIRSDNA